MKPIRNPQQLSLFRSSRFMTTGEAAAMLKVSVGTVYNLIEQGLLESYQRGNRGWRMVSHQSVMDLLQRWAEEAFGSSAEAQNSQHSQRAARA